MIQTFLLFCRNHFWLKHYVYVCVLNKCVKILYFKLNENNTADCDQNNICRFITYTCQIEKHNCFQRHTDKNLSWSAKENISPPPTISRYWLLDLKIKSIVWQCYIRYVFTDIIAFFILEAEGANSWVLKIISQHSYYFQ